MLLFGDQPTTEEANKQLYREGMLWGLPDCPYKPATPIAGVPLLVHAVEVYREAGFDVTIIGNPKEPKKLLGHTASYENPGHTLGDKIRFLNSYADDMVVVGGVDLYPTAQDVQGLCALLDEYAAAALVAPMVRGQELVERGFRADLKTKIYHFLDGADRSERLAFPQLYAVRPACFRLDTVASVADVWYKNRENGCNQSYWPLFKEYFREGHDASTPGFLRTTINAVLFSTLVWGSKKRFHDLPVSSFARMCETVAGLIGSCPADDVVIAPTNFFSLACDVDTEEELAIVRRLVEEGRWCMEKEL